MRTAQLRNLSSQVETKQRLQRVGMKLKKMMQEDSSEERQSKKSSSERYALWGVDIPFKLNHCGFNVEVA
jgi:hypothetical protein